jgi:hypothetical protein
MSRTTYNSFEPVVMLPVWKSVIVDMLTLFTFGVCRWRWGGVTLEEWYDGFTVVTFVADDSVKSDPESMGLVEQLSDAAGVEFGKPSKVSNRTLDALMNLTKRIESGEPIHGRRVTVEQTPDGPLTTFEDVVI